MEYKKLEQFTRAFKAYEGQSMCGVVVWKADNLEDYKAYVYLTFASHARECSGSANLTCSIADLEASYPA